MPSLNALRNFYRSHRSSLYTFIMLAIERVMQMFIGLWIASSIARNFDHATFANWQIAMSLWLVCGTIGNITGERVLLPRLCAESPEGMPRLWNTALAAKILTGLITALPLVVWGALLHDPAVFQLSLLWGLNLLVSAPVSLAVHESYAQDDFRTPQIARIIGMFCRLLVVVVVMWLDGPVTWVVWGWITEVIVLTLILCRPWLRTARFDLSLIDWPLMRTLFAQGIALAIAASASVALTRIDRITLGASMPAEVLSQYAASMTLLEAAFTFAAMLATIVGAKTLFKPGPISWKHHLGLTAFAASIAIAAATLLTLIAEPLMTTIYGEAYVESADYLRAATWLLPLVFAQAILQAPLLMRASKRFHVYKAVSAFVVGVIAATWAAHHQHYLWISAGAYLGYITLILFDLSQLRQNAVEIYGIAPAASTRHART